ncbi:MAG: GNAT family N-acetyltransferase [Pseudomonadota bacterium]
MSVYPHEHGLGGRFEADQLADLGDFAARYTPGRDEVFSVRDEHGLIASAAVDGGSPDSAANDEPAHARLRWVLVAPRARGRGLGAQLMAEALAVVDAPPARPAWLTTFDGLQTARRLYERRGFVMSHSWSDERWGRALTIQRFDRPIAR